MREDWHFTSCPDGLVKTLPDVPCTLDIQEKLGKVTQKESEIIF